MRKLNQPIHGIRCTEMNGWEVWSIALQYPLKCGSAVDAKRVAAALEVAFPRGADVDYSEADKAIQRYQDSNTPRGEPASASGELIPSAVSPRRANPTVA